MRHHRRALIAVVAASLCLGLAAPASAGQLITYKGRTDQERRVRVEVIKRDSGRRVVQRFAAKLIATCEDKSTRTYALGFVSSLRVGSDGEFGFVSSGPPGSGFSARVDGIVRFRRAEGTFEAMYPDELPGGEVQECSTGVVAWSADRVGVSPTILATFRHKDRWRIPGDRALWVASTEAHHQHPDDRGGDNNVRSTALVSREVRFKPECLWTQAGEAFELRYENRDVAILHNVAIAPVEACALSEGGSVTCPVDALVVSSEVGAGDSISVVDVPALRPGEYYVFCQVHPTQEQARLLVT